MNEWMNEWMKVYLGAGSMMIIVTKTFILLGGPLDEVIVSLFDGHWWVWRAIGGLNIILSKIKEFNEQWRIRTWNTLNFILQAI